MLPPFEFSSWGVMVFRGRLVVLLFMFLYCSDTSDSLNICSAFYLEIFFFLRILLLRAHSPVSVRDTDVEHWAELKQCLNVEIILLQRGREKSKLEK